MRLLILVIVSCVLSGAYGRGVTGAYERAWIYYVYVAERTHLPQSEWRIAVGCRSETGGARCSVMELIRHIWADPPGPGDNRPFNGKPPASVPLAASKSIERSWPPSKWPDPYAASPPDKLGSAISQTTYRQDENGISVQSSAGKPAKLTGDMSGGRIFQGAAGVNGHEQYYDAMRRIGGQLQKAAVVVGTAATDQVIDNAREAGKIVYDRRLRDMDTVLLARRDDRGSLLGALDPNKDKYNLRKMDSVPRSMTEPSWKHLDYLGTMDDDENIATAGSQAVLENDLRVAQRQMEATSEFVEHQTVVDAVGTSLDSMGCGT